MDKEFLQYIRDTGYDDLLEMNKENILKYKDTSHYQRWRVGNAYKDLAIAMRETRLSSMIISLVEFLNKCVEKIF